jgi:hypothetical protein
MPRIFRRLAAAFAACASLGASAAATLVDYTDAWFTPAESGNGAFVVQQGNLMFLTLYVYGGDTLPRWYYASSMAPTNSAGTTWSGTLYRSQGVSFAVPWNPAQLSIIATGTVTLNFTSPSQATMSYTVDNVAVTKTLQRFAFGADTLAGVYAGGLLANASQCSLPGTTVGMADRLTVDHSVVASPRFTIDFFTAAGQATTCTFTGTYLPQGKMGSIPNGTWSCSGGANNAGTFSMSEIAVNRNGLSAHFTGHDQYCASLDGYFGGMRDVQ